MRFSSSESASSGRGAVIFHSLSPLRTAVMCWAGVIEVDLLDGVAFELPDPVFLLFGLFALGRRP